MECAIQVQFLAFVTEHDLWSDYQSSFRKKHSTETAVVYLTYYILEHMDRQMITGAVVIDLKKAFDLVDHERLLFKLEHYGVRGRSLGWFRNYLTTRTQRVQFGNDMTSARAIRFGVHQGSILGPLRFVLYVNDPPQCLENCSINMYADDTVFYFTNLCTSEIARVVQDDLNGVVQSMESSRLILNQSKTKSMLFGSWQNLAKSPNFCIQLYGKTSERVAKFSYLGVVLNENLSWKYHVEYVSSKVSSRLGLLSRIRSCLTLEASCSHYLNIRELHRVLNWLNLASRRKMHRCILVFKCLNNLIPKYLTQYFTKNADLHDHATRRRNDLHPPKPKRNMGKRNFKYVQGLFISILYPIMLKVPRL